MSAIEGKSSRSDRRFILSVFDDEPKTVKRLSDHGSTHAAHLAWGLRRRMGGDGGRGILAPLDVWKRRRNPRSSASDLACRRARRAQRRPADARDADASALSM